jgi:hypothetical protein
MCPRFLLRQRTTHETEHTGFLHVSAIILHNTVIMLRAAGFCAHSVAASVFFELLASPPRSLEIAILMVPSSRISACSCSQSTRNVLSECPCCTETGLERQQRSGHSHTTTCLETSCVFEPLPFRDQGARPAVATEYRCCCEHKSVAPPPHPLVAFAVGGVLAVRLFDFVLQDAHHRGGPT